MKNFLEAATMSRFLHNLVKRFHPEGIPWPLSLFYNALSRSSIFQRHYEVVAKDICSRVSSGALLDIGTGPGWLLLKVREACPGLALTGVDIAPGMVEKARDNISRTVIAGAIDVREGAAHRLPFPDRSFDAVVSTGSLHHWKHPAEGLNETYRVLKPGGCALIYDLVRQMPAEVMKQAAREHGHYRLALLWLHSFEEPFYEPAEMEALAQASLFGKGRTYFAGTLCCLEMKKPS
jgi:ubiquinone/menaquinone biosynthesis C-methylase UbiE